MSVSGGPDIVEDGLVLILDTANGESFRGEPTENVAGTGNIYTNWNNSGTATWVNNDTSVGRLFSDVQVNSMTKDTTGNSHIAVGYGLIDASTWTTSVYVYIPSSAGTLAGSVPYFRSFPANTSRGSLTYNGSSNWNEWPRDAWIRIERSWNNTAGDTNMYISCYLDTAGNKIYLTAPQLEKKPYATPFVNGTRGTTVATGGGFGDLSGNGNNGELVNGPSFSSGNLGSLSFDGVDDRVSILNPLNQNNLEQLWTVSAWVNINNSNVSQSLISGMNAGLQLNHATTNSPLLYLNSGVNDYYIYGQSGRILGQGWLIITFVFRNSDGFRKIYRNGTDMSTSGPNRTSTPSGLSSTMNIGNGVSGNISQIQIYNRVLSPEEVLQNYNATKGRYGL